MWAGFCPTTGFNSLHVQIWILKTQIVLAMIYSTFRFWGILGYFGVVWDTSGYFEILQGTLRYFAGTLGYLMYFGVLRDALGQFGVLWGYFWGTLVYLVKQWSLTWCTLGYFGIVWGTLGVLWGNFGVLWSTLEYFGGFWGDLRNFR